MASFPEIACAASLSLILVYLALATILVRYVCQLVLTSFVVVKALADLRELLQQPRLEAELYFPFRLFSLHLDQTFQFVRHVICVADLF